MRYFNELKEQYVAFGQSRDRGKAPSLGKVKFIVGADAEKVRRELAKHKMTRTDKEVYDGTSAKETRSMLIMDDNTIGISSVNASVLANRANIAFTEKESKD